MQNVNKKKIKKISHSTLKNEVLSDKIKMNNLNSFLLIWSIYEHNLSLKRT